MVLRETERRRHACSCAPKANMKRFRRRLRQARPTSPLTFVRLLAPLVRPSTMVLCSRHNQTVAASDQMCPRTVNCMRGERSGSAISDGVCRWIFSSEDWLACSVFPLGKKWDGRVAENPQGCLSWEDRRTQTRAYLELQARLPTKQQQIVDWPRQLQVDGHT